MENLGIYLLENCYGTFLCVIIIFSFLFGFKYYPPKMVRIFSLLCVLVLTECVCGSLDRYLGESAVFSSWRTFLSWLTYLSATASMLAITEIMLRDAEKKVKWLITIPFFAEMVILSSCFFNGWCFSYDKSTNLFVSGPLIFIPRVMPIIYLVMLIVAASRNIRRSKAEGFIVIVGVSMVILDFINEFVGLFPVYLRETTISTTVLAYFMYFTTIRHIDEVEELSESFVESEERFSKEMVDQTIETLAFTIDAKDRYTKGHSFRVAKYSCMIARVHGKSDAECNQIYRAALLHDIGKISVRANIITKPAGLTDEEAESISFHPEWGAKILEKMKSIPYLRDGALYHHEKYDGTGYPAGLKGEEIPELARIISVADAYDAMTSYRSYRPTMDQALVKQEIWKGMGTQFDPHFAKIMISLIDSDANYDLREKADEEDEINFDTDFSGIKWSAAANEQYDEAGQNGAGTMGRHVCSEEQWCPPTAGIPADFADVTGSFYSIGKNMEYLWHTPVVLLYSSENGNVMGQGYEELGVMVSAGHSWRTGKATGKTSTFTQTDRFINWDNWTERHKSGLAYSVKFHREKNKVFVRLENELAFFDTCFALPEDYEKDVFISVSGEHCEISGFEINE